MSLAGSAEVFVSWTTRDLLAGSDIRVDSVGHHEIPLLVVPYMGPSARAWAAERSASWADLSGNADIRGDDLRIRISGMPNAYAASGRPANPFAPRYARVSRVLLVEPDRWWRQRDLSAESGLSDATVSRAVGHLHQLGLVERNDLGAVRPGSPSVLLDAWAQRYSFRDHRVAKFHAVGRSGPAVLEALASKLAGFKHLWAATGLAAANLYTRFADFRLTTLFVEQQPPDPESLGLRRVDRGVNVWLVVPRDEGVFYRRSLKSSVWCVHPVQTYLDLIGHPERAQEAAANLRADLLKWRA